jgi:hypothetical protein
MLTILNIDTDTNRLLVIGLFCYFIKACAIADEETVRILQEFHKVFEVMTPKKKSELFHELRWKRKSAECPEYFLRR